MYNLIILSILAIIPFPLTYIIPYPLAILYLVPVVFQLFRTINGKPIFLKDKTTEILSFLCLVFFVFDAFFISRRLIILAIHLTMGLVLIKTFSLNTKKDRYLFLLLLFFLISAGIANSFHIILFPYLLICLYYFLKFLMEDNNVEKKKTVLFSSITVLFSMAISIPLFILFPRIKAPYIPGIAYKGEELMYEENVLNINDMEDLRSANDIIMRVKFTKKIVKDREIYIRLKSFSRYNKDTWSQTKPEYKLQGSIRSGYFEFSSLNSKYDVIIFSKKFFQNLPLIYGAVSIELPLEFINVSRDGSILLPASYQKRRLKYKIGAVETNELYKSKEPSKEESKPTNLKEIKELSEKIIDGRMEEKEKIEKILSYFYENFSYGFDSISLKDFLFEKKIGDCKLFSTACVLLLREAGIPSRVAVGFLGGEKHPWQDYLIIRNSNSHAWVEAWVGGKWILIDPTPPSYRPKIKEGDIKAFFKYFFESISFFWDRNILGFTYSEQIQILKYFKSNLNIILKFLFYILFIISLVIIFIVLKNIKIKKTEFYIKYYKNLRKKSIKKLKLPEGIPPEKLSIILKDFKPEKAYYIDNFFKLYLLSSFGGKKINRKEMKYFYKNIKI